MTEEEMATHLASIHESGRDGVTNSTTTGEGVVFASEPSARAFCDGHDKDLVQIGAGWLARNRVTNKGPMPTVAGDVVVFHLHQLFRVWTVTEDEAQDPSENAIDLWSRTDAEQAARARAADTGGRIFWLQSDEDWSQIPE